MRCQPLAPPAFPPNRRTLRTLGVVVVVFPVLAELAIAADSSIDFNRDIRPILSNNCFTCHGPDDAERQADLRLDTRDGALADLGGHQAIAPGNPEASELLTRVTATDDTRMPPAENSPGLKPQEVELLRRWIQQEAPYSRHWSLIAPVRAERPEVGNSSWPLNDIDYYVLRKLERLGLQPARMADRYALIRRVSLDLTGLPPTPQQVEEFLADNGSDAYERLVDRLLKSDAYGERWASLWLDLARYADSAGYADDPPRIIWLYRNWVIQALNRNLPFDQFTVEQIAGDLLPEPTQDQLIATAFHRNTLTNSEGGTNDEEFRNVAVVDRVNTTMQVWMGTTMGCAQCHTHKYDPISQREYFQLFAFLNNTEDADRRDEVPVLSVLTDDQKEQQRQLDEQLAELRQRLKPTRDELLTRIPQLRQQRQSASAWQPLKVIASPQPDAKDHPTLDGGWIPWKLSAGQRVELTLEAPASGLQLHGLRLDLRPTDAASAKTALTVHAVEAELQGAQADSRSGRFVRVDLKGEDKMIHLAEVEVFAGDENVARKGQASQSSTDFGGPPERAIDGNTNGDYSKNSVTHTAVSTDPWWEVDLKQTVAIDRIVLWNRTDNKLQSRLNGATLSILDEDRQVVWSQPIAEAPQRELSANVSGRTPVTMTEASATSDSTVAASQPSKTAPSAIDGDPQTAGWRPRLQADRTESLSVAAAAPTESLDAAQTLQVTLSITATTDALLQVRLQSTATPAINVLPHAVAEAAQAEQRSTEQIATLLDYLRAVHVPPKPLVNQIAAVEKKIEAIKPITVPIMRELAADKQRTTKIQIRGNYRVTGDTVTAGVPSAFHAFPDDLPRNRLGLARWLVSRDNPLTARVIVNRYWEQLFGTGLVATSEEFGNQGEPPSHPELLDWLAVEFMDSGWDVKHLLTLIVTSATYRQNSDATPEKLEEDPYNQWLSRGPRIRLTAEMVRDQALSASGLLSRKMFGPSVNPPRPKLGLRAAFGGSTDWETSQGEDRYRRALYTSWRRSIPYPSMATFDAPSRNVCTLKRNPTNTPLQALVTMNDPVYIEAAQALARRVVREGGSDDAARLRYAFQLCLTRPPEARELERLQALRQQLLDQYSRQPEQALQMATDPLGPVPDGMDAVDLASWTVIGNVLLNLDEALTRR